MKQHGCGSNRLEVRISGSIIQEVVRQFAEKFNIDEENLKRHLDGAFVSRFLAMTLATPTVGMKPY